MPYTEIININNIDHAIVPFKYVSGVRNGRKFFIFLENISKKFIRNYKIGKIYILIPSWVEMQDVYQSSSEENIMTRKFEINFDFLKINKIGRLCVKIEDAEGGVLLLSKKEVNKLEPSLAQFILSEIDDIINKHYLGSGLSKGEEKELAYECFKYYRAIKKQQAGKKVVIPPCPGPVLLMNVCKTFSCSPDVARNISKRDIDLIMLAKEQESICEDPRLIGLK